MHGAAQENPSTAQMLIKIGYELSFQFPQSTPVMLLMSVHPSRRGDLLEPDFIETDPIVPLYEFIDGFGNRCVRGMAPAGHWTVRSVGLIRDSGLPDPQSTGAPQQPVEQMPPEVLQFLLGSRYCETDLLGNAAWSLFGAVPPGWSRVQAICDWVHDNVRFGYPHARPTRTAFETFNERIGVCRDFTHLAVALCRAMNIPARYCNGYLGDIGIAPLPDPMDFNAWFEAWIDGRWHLFDARHNVPRIGRVPVAKGRDAADTAMVTSFGPHMLTGFQVWTEEVPMR
jgi:transglutaminase-like putative cysteine protease